MFELSNIQWVVSVLVALFGIYYYRMKNAFKYWEKRGIPTLKPVFPFGNFGPAVSGREVFVHSITRVYNECKGNGAYAGFYTFGSPGLIVLDPEIIKNVTVKDFQYFHDRGMYYNEKDDPLSAHLFSIEGQKWKTLRAKLSPTFTSGKMKFMFPTMIGKAEELSKFMKDNVSTGADLEIKDVLARFTTDMIGTCALGIECNSLKNPNAELRNIGRKVFSPSLYTNIKVAFALSFSSLAKTLHVTITDTAITDFFINVISDNLKYREENNIVRNDFFQLLMQLKNKGCLDGEEGKTTNLSQLTLNEVAAQAFIFYGAGFETSSSAMSFCLYEMALNPDIQNKVRAEINRVLDEHAGQYTYEALLNMKYLDMVIDETLRKYPTLPVLNRECIADYTLPGTSTVIPRGTPVFIPVGGLHHDPDIYPDPDRFDPERFNEENKSKRHHFAYLPFGEGPRICIGMRFGLMQTRLGLITVLRNYNITKCDKTAIPLKIDPKSFLTTCLGGIWLRFEPITNQ